MSSIITLEKGDLKIELAKPGTYYQGTRFDWSGIFRSIEYRGESFADEWFDSPDPLRHDNVCGTSEEFSGVIGYDEAPVGGEFLKVGVGLLKKPDNSPYDLFHTYEIVDGGKRHLRANRRKASFTHLLKGWYKYRKKIKITGPDTFRISHRLKNTSCDTLFLAHYCHNFFTFGLRSVGPERSVEFGYTISGDWREDNIHARKDSSRIWMEGRMEEGQKSFIGNLTASSPQKNGYNFVLKAGSKSVKISCNKPMGKSVFWSNNRVFCPEPYIELTIAPGQSVVWEAEYTLCL